MANGIAWMVGARLADRLIGVFSTLILARLLMPSDFGLVAMATAIGAVLDLLGSFSFELALIQNPDAERKHYDTVWTFNVIFGAVCALGMVVLAELAAGFYREPRLPAVMYVLSASYLMVGLNNIGVVAFRKDLNFKQEFKFILARRVVTFFITIAAAWLLKSYWALLIGMTVGRLVSLHLSYSMNAYRPKLSLAAAGELFQFSKWLVVNNFLNFLLHDGCTFVIGRIFGATSLGVYTVSYEISNLPSTELVAPINRATFPGFSKIAERAGICDAYLKIFGMICLLILPVGLGIAAVARPLVQVALGEAWISAVPLIALLALHGALMATQGNNSPVWMALGHPRTTTIMTGAFLCVLFPALYFFLHTYGIVGAGYAYLLANLATLPFSMAASRTLLGFQWRDLLSRSWRPASGGGIMYGWVVLLDHQLAAVTPLTALVLETLSGALVYALTVLALWWAAGRPAGAEQYALERVKS
ncbi:MAG: lipopolysaccharide biosynthesis protein [Pseudomonadota bacterium]